MKIKKDDSAQQNSRAWTYFPLRTACLFSYFWDYHINTVIIKILSLNIISKAT